jgi:hypothetical protein
MVAAAVMGIAGVGGRTGVVAVTLLTSLDPADLPPEERTRDKATDWRKVSIPIHHLESLCAFGPVTVTPPVHSPWTVTMTRRVRGPSNSAK